MFAKWKEESTHLKVLATVECTRLFFNDCRLFNFSDRRMALLLPGDRNACELSLDDLRFEYVEPKEGESAESLAALIGGKLGTELLFFELF